MGMKLLLGKDIKKLDYQELELYKNGLMELLVKTRGNKRLIKELQLTLTHLQYAKKDDFGIAYI
ncbi:MAG: hypothetical protein J7K68_03085 [Candidatus Diapherotrites archaeon]|nr:hypothetical protein [Candidatus Diapherotrites archaeon]